MQLAETAVANISAMPHITKVSPRTLADAILFQDLYEVLKKHDADGRFGITLLHKHYEVADDEVLVEYTDEETRTQTIRVEKASDVNALATTETAWSLKDGKVQMSCQCINQNGHTHQHI